MIYTSHPNIELTKKAAEFYDAANILARICDDYIPFLEAGYPASANVFVGLFRDAENVENILTQCRDYPGMQNHIRDIENDQTIDLTADITSVLSAINTCRSIGRSIITDENGIAKTEVILNDGKVQNITVQKSEYQHIVEPLKALRAILIDR